MGMEIITPMFAACLETCAVCLHPPHFLVRAHEKAEAPWLVRSDTERMAERWRFLSPGAVSVLAKRHSCCLFLSFHVKALVVPLFCVFIFSDMYFPARDYSSVIFRLL